MATFLQLQQRVQTRLIDVRSQVTSEIPTLINEAIDALQSVHNFVCMRAELQLITNTNQTNPHILGQIPQQNNPAGLWAWKEPRGDPYYVLQIGDTREIVWLPNRQFTYRQFAPFDQFAVGPPRALLIGEGANLTVPDPSNPDVNMTNLNVEVYPLPDGLSDWNTAPGGQYRVNIPYWGLLPDLVGDSDTNWFTNNGASFIVDFATSRGFALDWDEARASQWAISAFGPKWDGSNFNMLGGWARVLMNKDKSISFAPGRTLVPRRDVFAPRDQWRQ